MVTGLDDTKSAVLDLYRLAQLDKWDFDEQLRSLSNAYHCDYSYQ